MPVHDWSRVEAGIFFHFHLFWTTAICEVLNSGLLPRSLYALAEEFSGEVDPNARSTPGASNDDDRQELISGPTVLSAPPQVRIHARSETDRYAIRAKSVVVRQSSGHRVAAVAEVVSPGNKSSRAALRTFVRKTAGLIRAGVNLLIVDLFPPTQQDPQGVHKAIWDEFADNDFTLPQGDPLTLAAYAAGECLEAFVEPTAVGATLVEMPLFLEPTSYVRLPLEETYRAAWRGVPTFWRNLVEGRKDL